MGETKNSLAGIGQSLSHLFAQKQRATANDLWKLSLNGYAFKSNVTCPLRIQQLLYLYIQKLEGKNDV
jgi:hypothetical protein